MQHLLRIFITLILVAAFIPSAALANEDGQQTIEADSEVNAQDTIVRFGTWGTCQWEFTDDGTLTVHPGEAGKATQAPWKREPVSNVKRIVFKEENTNKIVLNEKAGDLFENLNNLQDVNTEGLDTSKVTDMECMFSGCTSLTSLNLCSFDTSNVIDMGFMFSRCSALESLDLSNFKTSQTQYMNGMFSDCSSLESLDLSSFNTSIVISMASMFNNCTNLKSVNLSSFNTTQVTSFDSMFRHCESMTFLDISSFEMCSHKDSWGSFSKPRVHCMFQNCFDLETIYANSNSGWGGSSSYASKSVFPGCYSLIGGNGTKFSEISHSDINFYDDTKYARIDKVGEPGYFSLPGTISSITLKTNTLFYNGSVQKPTFTVKAGNEILTSETDFTIIWPEDLTNAGTKEVTIRGIGNYTGTRSIDFQIYRAHIPDAILDQSTFEYDGSAKQPNLTVRAKNGSTLAPGRDYEVAWPADTVSAGTKEVTIIGKGNYSGTKTVTYRILGSAKPDPKPDSKPATQKIPMYRLYNQWTCEHFYTASSKERKHLISIGWNDENIGWYAPASPTSAPVYRLYNPYTSDHHYTMSKAERDKCVKAGWRDEGIGWYSDVNKTTPIYRQYNPWLSVGSHNYTPSYNEHKHLCKIGWRDEQIAWYGC